MEPQKGKIFTRARKKAAAYSYGGFFTRFEYRQTQGIGYVIFSLCAEAFILRLQTERLPTKARDVLPQFQHLFRCCGGTFR